MTSRIHLVRSALLSSACFASPDAMTAVAIRKRNSASKLRPFQRASYSLLSHDRRFL